MRIVCAIFAVLYVIALGLLIIGTNGLFGQERDPLSGVFLIPLGLPWIWLADRLDMVGPAVAILAPLVNLLIPVLGAATFTHLFHRLQPARSARYSSGRTSPGP